MTAPTRVITWEPENNVYGLLRVLKRTDGRYVVYDGSTATAPTTEHVAREYAAEHGEPRVEAPDASAIREWLAGRPHTRQCRCAGCRRARAA